MKSRWTRFVHWFCTSVTHIGGGQTLHHMGEITCDRCGAMIGRWR